MLERVDDYVNDRFDRRHYNAYCGVWRDRWGIHWERTLLWHPAFWWDLIRPGSLWRGMRLRRVLSAYKYRKCFLYMEEAASLEPRLERIR